MFCLNYFPFHDYTHGAEQLKIKYRPADRTLEDFLIKYQEKSIVIDVNENFEEVDAKLFKELSQKYENIKLMVNFDNKEYCDRIKEYEIPFFFSNFVKTADQLNGLIPYHPTDMYICEELCFSIDRVSTLLHSNNIKVRVIPNICQSSFNDIPSIKKFFIRPEDIIIYSLYVDVFEIFSDEERQAVLYKIYNQGKWLGKIKDIIPSFKGELENNYVMNSFGLLRTKCGKRCMYKPESCAICDRFIETAETFSKNNLVVRQIREKKD